MNGNAERNGSWQLGAPIRTSPTRSRPFRLARNISFREFGEAVSISSTYLSKIECDEFQPPAERTICRISDLPDLTPDELLALAAKVASDLPGDHPSAAPGNGGGGCGDDGAHCGSERSTDGASWPSEEGETETQATRDSVTSEVHMSEEHDS